MIIWTELPVYALQRIENLLQLPKEFVAITSHNWPFIKSAEALIEKEKKFSDILKQNLM